MFASIVSPHFCELFRVSRIHKDTGDVTLLSYPPSDMATAVHRASDYQRRFDPLSEQYYWRATACQ